MNRGIDEEAVECAVKDLSAFYNRAMQTELEVFPKLWLREHRTLQQIHTGMAMQWFRGLAEHGMCDGRNEASMSLAKKVVPLIEEETNGATRLPLI